MNALDTLTATHAVLLVSTLLEWFIALGWLLAALVLPRFRVASLHWAGLALLLGAAFACYLGSQYGPGVPVFAVGNLLLVGAMALQVRGLQHEAGQRPANAALLALLALAALVQFLWHAPANAVWRIAATSGLLGALCAWSGLVMLRCLQHGKARPPRQLAALLIAPHALASLTFAARSLGVLLAPGRLVQDGRLHESISMLGALVWLFVSLGMALSMLGLVTYRLQRQLRLAATHDALTALPNRRAADDFMAHEALRAQRQGTPMSALMIDIDFFKKVNDQHGHAGGDHVLQTLSRLLKERARASDMVARWGGEEFLMLLPDTPAQGAQEMAEQLRQAVQNTPLRWQQQSVPITVSIGTATWSRGPFHANALIASADSALYQAKNTGRNRVCLASEVPAPPAHPAPAAPEAATGPAPGSVLQI